MRLLYCNISRLLRQNRGLLKNSTPQFFGSAPRVSSISLFSIQNSKFKHTTSDSSPCYGSLHRISVSLVLCRNISTRRPEVTLLNGHRCCYYSTVRNGSGGAQDGSNDISKDPEIESLLKEIKNDFKTIPGDFPAPDEDSQSPIASVATFSDLKQEGAVEDPVGSDQDLNQTSTETEEDESDIEDFIDYGYTVEDEIEEQETQVYIPPIELKRGKTGVFDLEELIVVLKDENVRDLCVISVPPEINYVDYMVLVSGISQRHVVAMAESIKWLHKNKKGKKDRYLKIEGLETRNWVAMDMGNIALHIFLPHIRKEYDLETLWTVGEKYDDKCQEVEDPYALPASSWPPSSASSEAADQVSNQN